MKIAILQPYFLPYIGYFQLVNTVDELVVYDKIKYTKKGWFNRNRILVNGKSTYISLPLKCDSDFLDVKDRYLAENWRDERLTMLNRIKSAYAKAPYFAEVYELCERIVLYENYNLFNFLLNSIIQVNAYMSITTPVILSSTIDFDQTLKAEEKVIAICKARNAKYYINPIGGMEIYDCNHFKNEGVELFFLKASNLKYDQRSDKFEPCLSILDVMMFNSKEKITEYLNNDFSLVKPNKTNV